MDALSSTPLPAQGGIEGLISALQGGGGGGGGPVGMPGGLEGLGLPGGAGLDDPGGAPDSEGAGDTGDLSPVEHIQQAMKHLMMAMATTQDESHGQGIVKGMGALQAILGGEQKRQKVLADAGAGG
jgi:hypothetical protein